MNEQQIRQALQEIAQENVPVHTDLWPAIEQKVKRPLRWQGWQGGTKLAGAGLALLALALFLLWLPSLFQVAIQPAVSSSPIAPTNSNLSNKEVIVAPTFVFPIAPEILPRYQVTMASPPESPEEILNWAAEFGLPEPKLFRDPRSPETLLALGNDGNRLLFHEASIGLTSIGYLREDWDESPEGETLSFAEGTAVAETFLADHNLLPQQYQVRDILSYMFMAGGYPPRILRVTLDLGGYALFGPNNTAAVGATLQIDPAGDIFWAGFLAAEFEETETVSIRPAQEVVVDFVNGRLNPIHMETVSIFTGQTDINRYYPPLPEHAIGDTVTVLETDDTHFLVAEDGSEIRATLRTGVGAKYDLFTPDLAEIVDQIEYSELQVTGTIVSQTAPDTWQLEVESWEILPQQAFTFSGCAVGSVEIDADGAAWIVAEEMMGRLEQNGRYRIPNLPPAIHEGERIEVCTERRLEPSEELSWQVIYAPPRQELYENDNRQEPIAIEQAASPYSIGETAVLTGVVTNDSLYQDDAEETPSLMLIADLPDGEIGHIYPLVGEPSYLQTITDAYLDQYILVTGTITTTSEELGGEQVIAVNAFHQPWPEQPASPYVDEVVLKLEQIKVRTLENELGELDELDKDRDTLVIEEIELAHYFDPTDDNDMIVLVWVVRGHSRDGQSRFIAYLPASE